MSTQYNTYLDKLEENLINEKNKVIEELLRSRGTFKARLINRF